MKKRDAPLILMSPLLGGRKCIPTDFLKLFDSLRHYVTEKFFLIFSQNFYYTIPKLCNHPKTWLWNRPLKTASFQHLYFTFYFLHL